MRIDHLDLIAYGPFTNQVLDFREGSEGLHLVIGWNEAGKSSAMRGLRDALYGIPARTNDDFVHRHPDLRVGFSLRDRDGSSFSAVRRKGNTKTLRHPVTDEPLDDRHLS
ncbi:MAG TPA: AAA family ATPase, partial [Pirellulaceae bacterium]